MRIVIIGILVFLAWLAFSNHWYLHECQGCVTYMQNKKNPPRLALNHPFDKRRTADLHTSGRKVLTIYPTFVQKSDSLVDEESLSDFVRKMDELLRGSNTYDRVQIVGHTDDRGEATQNYILGLKRAVAIRNFLKRMGFEAEKIYVSSQGEVSPLLPNTSKKNQKKNRRLDIYIQP